MIKGPVCQKDLTLTSLYMHQRTIKYKKQPLMNLKGIATRRPLQNILKMKIWVLCLHIATGILFLTLTDRTSK